MSDTNRKINIWINGRQVENSFKGISNAMRKARNELANMTIGSKDYLAQTKKLKQLQGILDDHRKKQGMIARGWVNIKNNIKQIAIGNFISNGLTSLVDLFRRGFSKIINSIGDFEAGMTNVFTLLDDNTFEKFGDKLKKGSKEVAELGFRMNDTSKSLFDAISAGVEAGESIDFLKESAILAKGGVTKLSTAVDGNTTILNAYNLATTEAGNVSAAFFSAQKEGKTTVDELATSIGKAAPIASSLGISYQELLSATAALTKKGIKTKESITYLKAAFSNLMKPSSEAVKILRKFNVPIGATEIKAVGLTGVLEKLNEVIKQNPDEIAKAIPSVEALTAVQALSGEGLEEYRRILENVQSDIGENSSLQKAYQKQMESFPNIMAQARERLNNFAIAIGEKLAPYIKEIIPLISGWTKKVMVLIDFLLRNAKAIKVFVKSVAIAATAVLSYNVALKANAAWSKLIAIWNNKSAIATNLFRKASLLAAFAQAKLTGNMKRAAAAQRALNLSMNMNPAAAIIGLLAAAGTAFMMFRDQVKEATDEQLKFNEAQEEMKEIMSSNKTIDQQFADISNMDKRQLTNFVDRAKTELERLQDVRLKVTSENKKLIESWRDSMKRTGASQKQINEYINDQVSQMFFRKTQIQNEKQRFKELESFMLKANTRLKNIKKNTPEELNTNKPGPGTKGKETDKLKEFKDKYERLRKTILDIRRKMNLADLTEEERALEAIRQEYDEQFEVLEASITHFEAIKEKKANSIRRSLISYTNSIAKSSC